MEDPPAQGRAGGGGAEWLGALRGGLLRRGWCEDRGSADVPVGPRGGVTVWRLRPRVPLVLLSGATPGKFYHSHPHVPSEFDELDFDMASQVRANLTTIRKIGANVGDHASELPFAWPPAWGTAAGAKAPGAPPPPPYLRTPLILHWVSNRGAGFEANRAELDRTAAGVLRELGMDAPTGLGTYETGGNVSDRRFLLETFAAFGLDGACGGEAGDAPLSGHEDGVGGWSWGGSGSCSVRIDIKAEFDPSVFMPYVAAYAVSGPCDLALFSVTAASGEDTAPLGGQAQVEQLLEKLGAVLKALGSSFDDVVLTWNRVADLDRNEEAVLMTRARKGLDRPLAESVLEIAESDPNERARDGTPVLVEYIVAAAVPRRGQGARRSS